MIPPSIVIAFLLATFGAGCLYAGARNQRLTVSGGRRPFVLMIGGAATGTALILMWRWFGPATAVFTWATIAMLVWSVLPLWVGWWRRPRGTTE